MTQDKSTPRPWGLSDATIREWAVSLANLRQGQSLEPRCEPPAAVDIELCRVSILTMFRAMPTSAVNSHDAMKECVEVLRKLRVVAAMLRQNAVVCLNDHHKHDYQRQGYPGWLQDAGVVIDRAQAALAKLEKANG